jgi:hypothetical protein
VPWIASERIAVVIALDVNNPATAAAFIIEICPNSLFSFSTMLRVGVEHDWNHIFGVFGAAELVPRRGQQVHLGVRRPRKGTAVALAADAAEKTGGPAMAVVQEAQQMNSLEELVEAAQALRPTGVPARIMIRTLVDGSDTTSAAPAAVLAFSSVGIDNTVVKVVALVVKRARPRGASGQLVQGCPGERDGPFLSVRRARTRA